jgi:hypothetical protein
LSKVATAATRSAGIVILVIFARTLEAQTYEYVPFTDSATWSINTKKYKTVGETVIDSLHYFKVYEQETTSPFEFDIQHARLTRLTRNDTAHKRVYSRRLTDTIDYLEYDFSMQVGDTILLPDRWHTREEEVSYYYAIRVNQVSIGTMRPNYHLVVNDIDSMITLADGSKRRQQLMLIAPADANRSADSWGDMQIWIEGIGSSTGLFLDGYEHFFWMVVEASPPPFVMLCRE